MLAIITQLQEKLNLVFMHLKLVANYVLRSVDPFQFRSERFFSATLFLILRSAVISGGSTGPWARMRCRLPSPHLSRTVASLAAQVLPMGQQPSGT